MPTLSELVARLNVVTPLCQAHTAGSNEADEHPAEGVEVGTVLPGGLTPQVAEFTIQARGGFHAGSVWLDARQNKASSLYAAVATSFSLVLSVNQRALTAAAQIEGSMSRLWIKVTFTSTQKRAYAAA
ncbi:MAG: hypothetical protein AAFY57_06270 [Cyanobacteria bacterium J06642_2]